MTLNGYYFAATGITEYAFFHGDRDVLSVSHDCLPDAPMRICTASGRTYFLDGPFGWDGMGDGKSAHAPGACFPFRDQGGAEAGWLYLLGADHFAVAVPGAALAGRIVHERLHHSMVLTDLDDEPVARMEYGLERILSRERYGEWFPRRYAAEVARVPEDDLLALALSIPFLGFEALEVR